MLKKFVSLTTELVRILTSSSLVLPSSKTRVGNVDFVDGGKYISFRSLDRIDNFGIGYLVGTDTHTVKGIYCINVYEADHENRVHVECEKYFYDTVKCINDSIVLQFRWSLETGFLTAVCVHNNHVVAAQYEFINGENESNLHRHTLSVDIPSALTGQTEILGVPIVWQKENIKELADKAIQAVFDRAESLILNASKCATR